DPRASARPPPPSDEDMAALQRRINEARSRPRLPLLVVDAMVPGQRLRFSSGDASLENALQEGSGEAIILGAWKGAILRHGVVGSMQRTDGGQWELRGRRHVKVLPPIERTLDDINMARAEFIEDEVREADIQVARSLRPLVQEWRQLVEGTKFERFEGQILGVLDDMGPMPRDEDAGALALWVAGLINPLPGLGVAHEIRPAALSAEAVGERLTVVLEGIKGSIGHLSGKKPLF
ncbi:unnamed protein product, partial [Prorocentrum cordatum]